MHDIYKMLQLKGSLINADNCLHSNVFYTNKNTTSIILDKRTEKVKRVKKFLIH